MRDADLSRRELRRALVLNALAHPVNVLVPAAVLVAAALLGALWLAPVALACWLVLAGVTFFDEREAQRVGERVRGGRRRRRARSRADPADFSLEIGARVKAANAAGASIHAAIEASRSPLGDVAGEVDELLAAMHADAVRAERIQAFLAAESPAAVRRRIASEAREPVRTALEAKLDALTRLQQRLDGLLGEMDHVVATLQTVQAEILASDDLEQAALEQGPLASQISELRLKVEVMSAGLEETFAETRVHGGVERDTQGR
jgi:hypothetical protein